MVDLSPERDSKMDFGGHGGEVKGVGVMNKTEARFSTSSEGIAAYLLWHSVYPDKWAELAVGPVLMYYTNKDYNGIMLKYWKGFGIPVCEFNECLVVSKRIFTTGLIEEDWFFDMWDEIYDIRSDYKNRGQLVLLDDEIDCGDGESGIMV